MVTQGALPSRRFLEDSCAVDAISVSSTFSLRGEHAATRHIAARVRVKRCKVVLRRAKTDDAFPRHSFPSGETAATGARLSAFELPREASGCFPLLVQLLLKRVNETLLRDGEQQHPARP